MSEGKTLWEMFTEKLKSEKEEPAEFKIPNPLKGKINDFVSIDFPQLSGKNFLITEIDVYKEFTDYILRDEETWVTLRICPISNPDPYSHKHSHTFVLFPDCEMEYNKELHKKILPSGILEVKDAEGELLATYKRCNETKEPYSAEITVLKDPEKPAETENLVYWDFERKTDDGKMEYYFVEMNSETGWTQMFLGFEVSEKDVMLLPAGKP